MAYNAFFNYLPKDDINIIFEIGANNGNDSAIICNYFKPKEYHIFEPTEQNFKILQSRFSNNKSCNFFLNKNAVYTHNGKNKFYICKSNSGASSILGKVKPEFCKIADKECNMPIQQHEKRLREYCTDIDWIPSEVNCIRLDTYCNDKKVTDIDLICIDVEGVGLSVLKSMGDRLKNVKYIISECDYGVTRENEETFEQINKYLKEYDFEIVLNKFQVSVLSDCLWKNKLC